MGNIDSSNDFLGNSASDLSKIVQLDDLEDNLEDRNPSKIKTLNFNQRMSNLKGEEKLNQSLISLKSQLMESFTFRNRKVKEKVLGKISDFFCDMESIEKKIVL